MNFKTLTTYILLILLGSAIGTFTEYLTGSFWKGMFAAFIYGLILVPQLAKLILNEEED